MCPLIIDIKTVRTSALMQQFTDYFEKTYLLPGFGIQMNCPLNCKVKKCAQLWIWWPSNQVCLVTLTSSKITEWVQVVRRQWEDETPVTLN